MCIRDRQWADKAPPTRQLQHPLQIALSPLTLLTGALRVLRKVPLPSVLGRSPAPALHRRADPTRGAERVRRLGACRWGHFVVVVYAAEVVVAMPRSRNRACMPRRNVSSSIVVKRSTIRARRATISPNLSTSS